MELGQTDRQTDSQKRDRVIQRGREIERQEGKGTATI